MSGFGQQLPFSSVEDTCKTDNSDSTHRARVLRAWDKMRETSRGTVYLGFFYGVPPYTLGSTPGFGAFGKGEVSMIALGLPVLFQFDLGTDTPLRGQRNRMKLSIDRQRLTEQFRKEDRAELERVRDQLSAAREQRSMEYRRLHAAAPAPTELFVDTVGSGATSLETEIPDTSQLNVPTAMFASDSTELASATMDADTLVQHQEGLSLNGAPRKLDETLPSIDANTDPEGVNKRIADLEREESRLTALLTASRVSGFLPRLLQGVRSFEIGICTPRHSTYLINGTSITGISAEIAANDLYLAFDHGKSYDDAWRDMTRTDDQLRALQQTFFFQDAEDLNPRRLTAVKVGFGLPERTHVHVGYLYGKRNAVPMGLTTMDIGSEPEENQVIELDAGVEVAKGHGFRLQIGRSVQRTASLNEGDETGAAGFMDRRKLKNQALQVSWHSEFEKTRSVIEVSGRVVDDHFHSMGVAFLRPGTRAAEVALRQQVGKKLTVRSSYRAEERDPTGSTGAHVRLGRWRMQGTYRPAQWVSLRSSWAPLIVRTSVPGLEESRHMNSVLQGGVDLRKRSGKSRIGVHLDGSRFTWTGSDTMAVTGSAWSLVGGVSLSIGERCTMDGSVNRLEQSAVDSALTGYSAGLTATIGKASQFWVRVAGDLSLPGWPTSSVGWNKPFGKHVQLKVALSYSEDRKIFFSESFEDTNVDTYTCQVAFGFSW
jgi:hypothetical protein